MKMQCLLSIALSAALLAASPPLPRPSFLPPLPNAAKPVAEYSASELLGAVCTAMRVIPQGHPYLSYAKDWPRLKADWPGAKTASTISALLNIVLDVPEGTDVRDVWDNVQLIIRDIIAGDDSAKVTAVLLFANAQLNPSKRHKAISYASLLFGEFLDTRLLNLMLSELDDQTEYTERYAMIQGRPRKTRTYRGAAREAILCDLTLVLELNIDKDAFRLAEEAAGCAALKDWLNAHWGEIEAKCAEKKADPNRQLPSLVRTSWGL